MGARRGNGGGKANETSFQYTRNARARIDTFLTARRARLPLEFERRAHRMRAAAAAVEGSGH